MFKENERIVVEGDETLFKTELQSIIDNYDHGNSSFVGFHIVRGEQGKRVQVICNLNPKDMPTLHKSFSSAMKGYLETIATQSPMMAAKIMAQMMMEAQNEDDEEGCTCGHCDED